MRALCSSDRSLRSPSLPTFPFQMLPFACLFAALPFVLAVGPAEAGPYTDSGHLPLAMAGWASEVDEVVRGPVDIANPALGLASFGAPQNALGAATANYIDVVSLGDGGSMTLYLDSGVHNGPGDDLAIYENGFYENVFPADAAMFAELAFVEVASNGIDFVRFPVVALNPFPIPTSGTLNPSDYHGLAGRHETGLGTGFDLADLASNPLVVSGDVDLMNVRYVRIVDVVGNGSRVDGAGRPIYDPYATRFASGGFDLEAVGALHVVEPSLASGLLAGVGGLFIRTPRRRRAARSTTRVGRSLRGTLLPLLAVLAIALTAPMPGRALTATFDDLGMAPNSFLNGSTLAGGYTSGGVFFENDYTAAYDVFSGFAASTTTNTTTPGYGNQFSNITGAGAGGSSGFGLAFLGGRIVLPEPQVVQGASFTNTTYAALSMRDGDFFSKKFGGPSGSDPDYFRLLVEGIDAGGSSTGTVELMLADFRFSDDSLDSILDAWVFLDLSGLGAVRELHFGFESSDVGAFGINTPTYFAIDDLVTIPEPGAALLIGLGIGILGLRPRTLR